MMKKNVMAEGEELRVNKRLGPSELVSSRLLYNTVCIYLLTCDIYLDKNLKVLEHSVGGTTYLSLIFSRWYYLPYRFLNQTFCQVS